MPTAPDGGVTELTELPRFTAELPFRARRLPDAGLRRTRTGSRRAGLRANRRRQDGGRRVRRAPGAGGRRKVLLHHADQGAEQPEAHRSDGALRPRPDRAADRRRVAQRRCAGGGHDHRGAAQHALRGFGCAARTFACGDGRGAFPGRPDAGCGVGGGDPASARRGATGQPVGDGEQRRGVRRLDPDRARRHDGGGRRAPAGAAVAARSGRQASVRPVRLRERETGRRSFSRA